MHICQLYTYPCLCCLHSECNHHPFFPVFQQCSNSRNVHIYVFCARFPSDWASCICNSCSLLNFKRKKSTWPTTCSIEKTRDRERKRNQAKHIHAIDLEFKLKLRQKKKLYFSLIFFCFCPPIEHIFLCLQLTKKIYRLQNERQNRERAKKRG